MDGLIDLIWFIIKLPFHIYHTVTFGKYHDDDTHSSIYEAVAIVIVVFSILGGFINLLLRLK